MIYCCSFKLGVKAFRSGKTSEWKRPRRGRTLRMAEDGSGMEVSSGWQMTSRRLDVTEALGVDSGSSGFLGESSW